MAVSELGVMCRARADEARAKRNMNEEIATTKGLPTMKVAKELKALVWLVLLLLGGEKRESSAGCNEKAAAREIKGTSVVAIPRDRIKGIGTKIKVDSAMVTVSPDMATVRPALAMVRTIASL